MSWPGRHTAGTVDGMTPQPSTLRLREPANLVDRRAIGFWALRAGLGWLAVLAVQVVVIAASGGGGTVNDLLLTITVVLALGHVLVMPVWRYRVHRWEVTADAVYTQSGWLNQERRIAPISRIQTVDSERGPLSQLFGLAEVTVTTASAAGPLKIHGLRLETADQLVHQLTSRTSKSDGDAT